MTQTLPVTIPLSPATLRSLAALQAQLDTVRADTKALITTIVEQSIDVDSIPGWSATLELPNIVISAPTALTATTPATSTTPSGDSHQ